MGYICQKCGRELKGQWTSLILSPIPHSEAVVIKHQVCDFPGTKEAFPNLDVGCLSFIIWKKKRVCVCLILHFTFPMCTLHSFLWEGMCSSSSRRPSRASTVQTLGMVLFNSHCSFLWLYWPDVLSLPVQHTAHGNLSTCHHVWQGSSSCWFCVLSGVWVMLLISPAQRTCTSAQLHIYVRMNAQF